MMTEQRLRRVYFRLVKGTASYDKLIRWYTRSPYTHVEFAYPLHAEHPEHWIGAQPSGGVQVRPRNYLHREPYDLFYLDVTDEQYAIMSYFVERQIGKKYDFWAIANMGVFTHDVESTKRWFCSELFFATCKVAGVTVLNAPLKQRDRITPRDIGMSPIIVKVHKRSS